MRRAGFTLIELLIVIGILGMLAAVLLPNIFGAKQTGEIAETKARIEFLRTGVEAYERKNAGAYPSDRVQDLEVSVKPDQENAGIEALVIALVTKPTGRDSISDHLDWLANTDEDDAGAVIKNLERKDKLEVVDAWGTPLAYFCSANDGYTRSQRIRLPNGGDTIVANALRDPKSGKYLAAGKFQILSAGPDRAFNTPDDVTYPELPAQ